MSKILDRLELAANTNPAEALKLLPELFRAVHEGIIVELPCKVGDTAYFPSIFKSKIICGIVDRVTLDKSGIMIFIVSDDNHCYVKYHFGEDVFFSREEAIKRLESEK